jgi:hypothetical protein
MAVPKWVLKETAEVLGVVGIIAGIVFLGYELRQNNELMEVETRRALLETNLGIWEQVTNHPDLAMWLVKDRSGETLAVEEELRLNAFWMVALLQAEWAYLENRSMEPFIAPARRNWMTYGSYRRAWEESRVGAVSAGKDNFDPAFVEFFDQTISNVAE